MSASQVWLTTLGGLIAGVVGLLLFFVQHGVERKDRGRASRHEALREFGEALMPLLIELDRWRYNPDQTAVWVGGEQAAPAAENVDLRPGGERTQTTGLGCHREARSGRRTPLAGPALRESVCPGSRRAMARSERPSVPHHEEGRC